MNIPPYLEKLLLSNEAEFRTATLGLNGSNLLPCPVGKSIVVLELTIQPFANYIGVKVANMYLAGSSNFNTAFTEIVERLLFQIQICNDKFNQHISYTNSFSFTPVYSGIEGDPGVYIQMNFLEKKESLFIYSDRGLYFNFIYYSPNTDVIQYAGDDFASSFKTRIQAEPNYPITSLGNPNEGNYSTFENTTKTLAYYPNTKEQTFSAYTPAAPGQSEGFRLVHGFAPNTTIMDPSGFPSALNDLTGDKIFMLPVFNVKYALINKRSTDKGLY